MKINILTLPAFDKAYKKLHKKYPSIKLDIKELENELISNSEIGIDLGNDIRKVRLQIKSKNSEKRRGARIITYSLLVSLDSKNIILVTMYEKGKTETISITEIKSILQSEGLLANS
jgi:mRNA-degrading endonuclease RelE of RelBE toxin-antitoxin system